MGREVRRVPIDFDWPQHQVWQGYLIPDEFREGHCSDCAYGATDAREWLRGVAYIIAGLADDAGDEAMGRPMHPYLQPLREISYNRAEGRPGQQFAEFADGIAPDAASGFIGRDVYRILTALINAAGLPEGWGTCPTCQGYGTVERYAGQRAEADAWEPTDPPTGEGWQMWETTSEGSPISPVFGTAEELAEWLAGTGASLFGKFAADRDHWLRVILGEEFAHIQIAPGVIAI